MLNTRKYVEVSANNSDELYVMNSEELKKLKKYLLEMYVDIFEVCERNNIKVILGGGTALGAVRHGGFIPWDDDLDLLMSRQDYNEFIKIFDEGLSQKYEITTPNSKYNVSKVFTKIYKKNTTLEEIFNINSDAPKGIFIDIFPIEYIPQNKLIRILKGTLANIVYYIAASVSLYQLRNNQLQEFFSVSKSGGINYKLRKIIGFFGSFVSYKKWINLYDRALAQGSPSDLCGIPSGKTHYFGEILPKKIFFPPKDIIFEDQKAYVPNDADKYLTNLYGDYMKIPPIEKRERHYFIKFLIEDNSID